MSRGWRPGSVDVFLKSIRGTDAGSQVTGSKSVGFSFSGPACAGMSQPPVMDAGCRGSGSLSHSPRGGSGWQMRRSQPLGSLNSGTGRPGPQTRRWILPTSAGAPRHCAGSTAGHVPDALLSLFPGGVGHLSAVAAPQVLPMYMPSPLPGSPPRRQSGPFYQPNSVTVPLAWHSSPPLVLPATP